MSYQKLTNDKDYSKNEKKAIRENEDKRKNQKAEEDFQKFLNDRKEAEKRLEEKKKQDAERDAERKRKDTERDAKRQRQNAKRERRDVKNTEKEWEKFYQERK